MYSPLLYDYVDDIVGRRAPFREAYLALARETRERGVLLMAGAPLPSPSMVPCSCSRSMTARLWRTLSPRIPTCRGISDGLADPALERRHPLMVESVRDNGVDELWSAPTDRVTTKVIIKPWCGTSVSIRTQMFDKQGAAVLLVRSMVIINWWPPLTSCARRSRGETEPLLTARATSRVSGRVARVCA